MTDRGPLVEELVAELRRHVGHVLRCSVADSGDVAGYVVETIAIRCEDCGEVVLEAVQRVLYHTKGTGGIQKRTRRGT